MAWKHLEKPTMQKVSRALANEFANMEPLPHDRNFNPTRGEFIKSAIVDGRFRVCDFASFKCKATGKTYRVNGKHTSMVLAEMNGDFPRDLFAVVERYEGDTMEDGAKLYATFDHKRCLRSVSDINKAFAASHVELAEIPLRIINTCATAISYAMFEDAYHQHEADVRAALLLPNSDFVIWVYFLMQGHNSSRHPLMRGAVVAAMFKSFGKNQKKASEFWEHVRDEDHPSNVHPTRTLAKWLNSHAMRTGAKLAKGLDSPRGMFVRSIHAWNAFRDGSDLTELRYFPKAKTPAAK